VPSRLDGIFWTGCITFSGSALSHRAVSGASRKCPKAYLWGHSLVPAPGPRSRTPDRPPLLKLVIPAGPRGIDVEFIIFATRPAMKWIS